MRIAKRASNYHRSLRICKIREDLADAQDLKRGNSFECYRSAERRHFPERRLLGSIALTRAKPTGAAFRPAVADVESRSAACDFPLYSCALSCEKDWRIHMPILHNWLIIEFRISRVSFLSFLIRRIQPLGRPLDPTSMLFKGL
jgi:hypothetical protein